MTCAARHSALAIRHPDTWDLDALSTIVRTSMGSGHHSGGRNPALPLWAALAVGLALSYACSLGEVPSAPGGGGLTGTAPFRLGPVDVLVFAPHPDDEV